MKIDKLLVKFRGRTVGTLSLTPDSKTCTFEYDKAWLASGFSLSPFELPLQSGVFVAKPEPFAGGFGVFEDSLPDGYGRYLLHIIMLKQGINDYNLTTIDRLSLVGNGGMGALTYEPATELSREIESCDFDVLQSKAIEVLSEKNDDAAELLLCNSRNSGGCRPKMLFKDQEGHWIVKFRHTYDPIDIGIQEYKYNIAAKHCGIDIPDIKLINDKYFAVKRFDILPSGERLHTVTAGGLLGISLDTPILDYSNLLALTGFLTKDGFAVEEMFKRMIFNYITDNKDDHCKNFSFYVNQDSKGDWKWYLAPAYDLTYCAEGYNGEHATSINGKGNPTVRDILAVGAKVRISEERCLEIMSEVAENCKDIAKYIF
jgi:serine/threonine-protein kinase HipA